REMDRQTVFAKRFEQLEKLRVVLGLAFADGAVAMHDHAGGCSVESENFFDYVLEVIGHIAITRELRRVGGDVRVGEGSPAVRIRAMIKKAIVEFLCSISMAQEQIPVSSCANTRGGAHRGRIGRRTVLR